ncbi:MAG: DUF3283 family protein [Candidatus Symbiodolus clandestinus]
MPYNLAELPIEAREQLQLEKSAAYLAWQEQQGKLTAAAVQQQIAQQPEALRAYFIEQFNRYR